MHASIEEIFRLGKALGFRHPKEVIRYRVHEKCHGDAQTHAAETQDQNACHRTISRIQLRRGGGGSPDHSSVAFGVTTVPSGPPRALRVGQYQSFPLLRAAQEAMLRTKTTLRSKNTLLSKSVKSLGPNTLKAPEALARFSPHESDIIQLCPARRQLFQCIRGGSFSSRSYALGSSC